MTEPTARTEAADAATAAVEANRVAVASQAEAHGEAVEANRVAVKAQVSAASDRALVAGGMVDLAASNREMADAIQVQAAQAAEDAQRARDEQRERAESDAKSARRRAFLQLGLLIVLLIAVIGGLYEGSLYVQSANRRATVNGGTLKRLDDNTAAILRTNDKIDNYTTGPAAIAGRMQLQQELDCLTAAIHHDVLGVPTPTICVTLGIK